MPSGCGIGSDLKMPNGWVPFVPGPTFDRGTAAEPQ